MKSAVIKFLFLFLIGIIGGIFGGQILWPYFVSFTFLKTGNFSETPIYVTEKKEITIRENEALQQAIKKVENTIVGVRTKTKKGEILEGSGVVLTSDGLVVTLAQLLPWGSKFHFWADGEWCHYQILKRDLNKNLALVKLKKENLATRGFAEKEKIQLGERIFFVSVDFVATTSQFFLSPKLRVNEGIITKINSDLIETNIVDFSNVNGAGVFDIEGNLVGLVQKQKNERIFVIPVDSIKEFTGF